MDTAPLNLSARYPVGEGSVADFRAGTMVAGASHCDQHHLWRGRKLYRPPVRAIAACRVAQTRGRRSADGRGIERAFDGFGEIRFTKRLPHDHGARPEGLNRPRVPTDEEMRNRSGAENLFDRRNTATSRQSRINDDQVRPVSGGRPDCVGLGGCRGADIMAHSCEQFRKEAGDQGIVLDDEDSKRFHRSICARSQLDRHYYSCSACSVAGCADRRVETIHSNKCSRNPEKHISFIVFESAPPHVMKEPWRFRRHSAKP